MPNVVDLTLVSTARRVLRALLEERGCVQELSILADRRPIVVDPAVLSHKMGQPVAEQFGRAALETPGREGIDRGDDGRRTGLSCSAKNGPGRITAARLRAKGRARATQAIGAGHVGAWKLSLGPSFGPPAETDVFEVAMDCLPTESPLPWIFGHGIRPNLEDVALNSPRRAGGHNFHSLLSG